MPVTLLAGGTGFVGTRLATLLRQKGHIVRLLVQKPAGEEQFAWNTQTGYIDEKAVAGADFIINLAGAGIADKRWSEARRRQIIDSRVKSTQLLLQAIERSGHQPTAYVSASAIGYYGNSGEKRMLETDAPADHKFMVQCCEQWEQAADSVAALSIRTVKLRTGVVLGKDGGALLEFLKPLRFGLGTYFGDGQAWYSWIHLDDICRAYIWALETPEAEGVYNAVAPCPVRIKPLAEALVRARRKPAVVVPVPAFALRLWFGEMSSTILNSNLVSAEKIGQAGFTFEYPVLEDALQAIFRK